MKNFCESLADFSKQIIHIKVLVQILRFQSITIMEMSKVDYLDSIV
jgi:hypothetical protein